MLGVCVGVDVEGDAGVFADFALTLGSLGAVLNEPNTYTQHTLTQVQSHTQCHSLVKRLSYESFVAPRTGMAPT